MTEEPTSSTLRCFVAIASPLAEAARPLIDELESVARNGKFRLRIVPAENFHITLKFLGNVQTDQIGLLDSILRNQSANQARLQLTCRGIGFFSNSLYMGIERNDPLNQLAAKLNEAFTFLGYPRETIEFLPHITLARFPNKARTELSTSLQAYRNREWGKLSIESVQLFNSETLAEGARYSCIGNYPLVS